MLKKTKEGLVKITGIVKSTLPGCTFKVLVDDTDIIITAHSSGNIKRNRVKIIVGDKVIMEISKHGKSSNKNGRIIRRL